MATLDLEQAKAKYIKAREAYNNAQPLMTDAQFDRLEDAIRRADPKWQELKKTGAAVRSKKTKAKLLEFMPSLSKFYPEAVSKWLKPDMSYMAMSKLDGSSLQLLYVSGELRRVITRGDGEIGGDISFLGAQLSVPQKIKTSGQVVFRCEAVMQTKVFDRKYAEKFDNPRNLVAGLLNRASDGQEDPMLKDVDIVVLGVFSEEMNTGLRHAARWGFKVVEYKLLVEPTPDSLVRELSVARKSSPYEMDGLVLCGPTWRLRYRTNDRPKDIVAFKVNADDETIEAEVLDIIYQESAQGRINIRAKLKPVRLGGVTIQHATLHNAEWMQSRKIGPGAVVKIVRSGGVIPKVVDVVKGGRITLPTIAYVTKGKFFFVDKKRLGAESSRRIEVLKIAKFLNTLGLDLLAAKTIDLCFDLIPNVEAYLKLWHRRRLGPTLIEAGVGEKTSSKICAEFDRVFANKQVSMRLLMVGSSVFDAGMGDRKLLQIEEHGLSMQHLVDILTKDNKTALQLRLLDVRGFSGKTATLCASGIEAFVPLFRMYQRYILIDGSVPKAPKKVTKGPLKGQFVSFTGYRDKEHELAVADAGGQVVPYGSKTTILLYREGGKASQKVEQSRKAGRRVCTFETLSKELDL